MDLERLAREAEKFQSAAERAQSTRKNYGYDWKSFVAWCHEAERPSLPASCETVALYLSHLLHQKRKISTAQRHAASINYFHQGFELPARGGVTRALLQGAQRVLCEKPKQKRAIRVPDLRAMSAALRKHGTPRAMRDRSILTLGLASALRRSNLVALNLADVEFQEEGVVLRVSREKQDQMGKGRYIGVARGSGDTCPVEALREWLALRGLNPGPLYARTWKNPTLQRMHPSAIATVVKMAVALIGLDASQHAGHSLRSGLVTAAIENRVSDVIIQQQTGHRSQQSLQRYHRSVDLFRINASAMIGL